MAKTVIEEFDSMSFTNVGIQFIEGAFNNQVQSSVVLAQSRVKQKCLRK